MEAAMDKRDWRKKRAQQGYSYHEVLAEMKRRYCGERMLDKREAARRFKEGVLKLDRAFRFSSYLCDLLLGEGLNHEDLQNMAGIRDEHCLLQVLIDPVSRGKKGQHSLRNNTEVDSFYPGRDAAER